MAFCAVGVPDGLLLATLWCRLGVTGRPGDAIYGQAVAYIVILRSPWLPLGLLSVPVGAFYAALGYPLVSFGRHRETQDRYTRSGRGIHSDSLATRDAFGSACSASAVLLLGLCYLTAEVVTECISSFNAFAFTALLGPMG